MITLTGIIAFFFTQPLELKKSDMNTTRTSAHWCGMLIPDQCALYSNLDYRTVSKKYFESSHCWIIWLLIVKTKISPLVVRYQGCNGCQKNQQNLRNLDLEVYCANIQLNLTKLWSSTKNQLLLMASGGFLKFLQYLLNISAITQQIYL